MNVIQPINTQRFGKIDVVNINTYPTDIISIEEAKNVLRVDLDEDDQYIDTLILAATNTINQYTERIINSTKIKYSTKSNSSNLRLPYEAVTVDSVQLVSSGTSGNTDIVYTIDNYDADDTYIYFTDGIIDGEFEVIFDTGYTETNILPVYKEAIYLLVAHWYDTRQLVAIRGPEKVPMMIEILLDTYRRINI